MVTTIFFISTLLLPCLFLSIIYYTIRMWLVRREFQQYSYQEEPAYQKLQKRRRFAACALPIAFIVCFASALIHEDIQSDERAAQLLAKAESYTGEDKQFYDSKFNEFKKSIGESKARKKAVELTEKNIEYNYRINNFNDDKRTFFNEKFNEYKKSMDEFSAKEKAIKDLDEEFDKRDKELQKKYDDQKQYEEWIAWQQSEKEKAEKAELQKKYDDQKQYEEWIAWQQSEKEKAEKAELQKKYDDQKKYEEWIAWKQAEEEKNRPIETSAQEMLSLFDGNRDAAKEQFEGKKVHIRNCIIEFIGNNTILCNYSSGYSTYKSSSSIRVSNPKKLSNYMNLRAGDVIDITGNVTSVNVVVGETAFGDVYGYKIELE